jgi:hypothetical protein
LGMLRIVSKMNYHPDRSVAQLVSDVPEAIAGRLKH